MGKGMLMMFLLMPLMCHSALYQCKNDVGEVEFMDIPCPQESNQIVLKKEFDERGFFKKYFSRPNTNRLKSICKSRYCFCGPVKIKLQMNSERQLVESAKKIPWLWRGFNDAYSRYQKNKNFNKSGDELVQRKACELTLHQDLFNKSFGSYSKRLDKTKKVEGSVTGVDIECGENPIIKPGESEIKFRHRYKFHQTCQEKKRNNYRYNSSKRNYDDSKKTLERMESALGYLRRNL